MRIELQRKKVKDDKWETLERDDQDKIFVSEQKRLTKRANKLEPRFPAYNFRVRQIKEIYKTGDCNE